MNPAHQDKSQMYQRFKGKNWQLRSARRKYSGENFSVTQKSKAVIEKMDTLDDTNANKIFMAGKIYHKKNKKTNDKHGKNICNLYHG